MFSKIFDAIGDPFNMLFNGNQYVAQNRWAAGTGNSEQVWKSMNLQPEVCNRPIRPLIDQCLALPATDVNSVQSTGHGIESRGINQDVKFVLVLMCTQA